ncbi:hypothetical protein ABZW02_20315 [Streptomyces sp. NPDC005180]|uniref:hypothetical protein n=1 Tax=Streptomyces sp. NPDC005180 TaxID=3156868 RepID=UPI0033BD38DA
MPFERLEPPVPERAAEEELEHVQRVLADGWTRPDPPPRKPAARPGTRSRVTVTMTELETGQIALLPDR